MHLPLLLYVLLLFITIVVFLSSAVVTTPSSEVVNSNEDGVLSLSSYGQSAMHFSSSDPDGDDVVDIDSFEVDNSDGNGIQKGKRNDVSTLEP